jgi:hypothetical protein
VIGMLRFREGEAGHISTRHRRPYHAAAVGRRPFAEALAPVLISQQIDDLAGNRGRIAPGHEDSSSSASDSRA